MWFRRLTGITFGLLVLALGVFLAYDELQGSGPPRWWFPLFALVPGALILTITWLTWPAGTGIKNSG
jgi:hypothetical protein